MKTTPSRINGAETEDQKPFMPRNFLFMAIALFMIVLGFALMGGSSNPPGTTEFNYDIFSVRRIIVGPTIAFLGFVGMAFAIIYTPRIRTSRQTPKP